MNIVPPPLHIEYNGPRLPPPEYSGKNKEGSRLALMVASMKHHMTDEGYQLGQALGENGYELCGYDYPEAETFVPAILTKHDPSTVVLQDKREWEGRTAGKGFDISERYTAVECLKTRHDIFKLTVLKDAQNNPEYHKQSADEIGCHAWIVYYLPSRVARIAPYVREEHLVRTYHTVDAERVPKWSVIDAPNRKGCLLSGALSGAYPLRQRLVRDIRQLPETTYLPHPGYHRNGPATYKFMETLTGYKVAICTASRYGYALRKIVEATACGCKVLTDLPVDDCLPGIDGNLYRIQPHTPSQEIARVVQKMINSYSPSRQMDYALTAQAVYDYRVEGKRLASAIESLRQSY